MIKRHTYSHSAVILVASNPDITLINIFVHVHVLFAQVKEDHMEVWTEAMSAFGLKYTLADKRYLRFCVSNILSSYKREGSFLLKDPETGERNCLSNTFSVLR